MLDGKVAIVTGGGTGIGRAASLLFSKEGAKVVVAGRTAATGEDTVHEVRQGGGDAVFVRTDVSKLEDVDNLIDTTVRTYGRLDCAFNNAGVGGPKATLVETADDDWDDINDTNVRGTFLLVRAEAREMMRNSGGAIVNMASVCSFIVRPGRCAYNTSRHAVVGLTKSAALDLAAKGIRVNAVAPGSTRTAIFVRSTQGNPQLEEAFAKAHPIQRIAEPDEIAEAALWLCSERSSFVIGHVLTVDGGLTLQ